MKLDIECLQKVAGWLQQINSHMDASNCEFRSVSISSAGAIIHIGRSTFLSAFSQYEIVVDNEKQFPYRLSAFSGGIEFVAYFKTSEIVDLKKDNPEQWEYIQAKVQLEGGELREARS